MMVGPCSGFCIKAAKRISMNMSRLLLQGGPSAAKDTLTPLSISSGIGAIPDASLRLLEGQWATFTCREDKICFSSSFKWMQCAKISFSLHIPSSSRYTMFRLPLSLSTSLVSDLFSDAWV